MEKCDDSRSRPSLGQACKAAVDYGIDLGELDYMLSLTPFERLLRHDQALLLVIAAQKAGARYYGFNPRPAEGADKA